MSITFEQVDTQDIVDEVIATAQKHGDINQALMDQFEFSGKSLTEWMDDVAVPIPTEVTPENFRNAFTLWARKFQKVNYYYSMANTMFSAMSSGGEIKKSDLISALMEHYAKTKAKRPAAATLERMADSYMVDTVNTRIAAKIVRDFWKDRKDTLIEVRKALESIGISMNMEMKYHET
jgi:hypothetical protein